MLRLALADLPGPVDRGDGLRFGWLSSDELASLASDSTWDLTPEFLARLAAGHDRCWGAWCGNQLAGYSWYATGSIEAEHAAGIALGVPPEMAYMYKALTRSEFRGRGLYGRGIASAFRELSTEGISQLVALVDWTNLDSLAGCRKLGFRSLGRLTRFDRERGPAFWLPANAVGVGLRFGEAVDLSPRQRAERPASHPSDKAVTERLSAASPGQLAEFPSPLVVSPPQQVGSAPELVEAVR